MMRSSKDAYGETLPLGFVVGMERLGPSIRNCANCHGTSVGARLFANSNANSIPRPLAWDRQCALIVAEKEKSDSWKIYRELQAKESVPASPPPEK